MEQEDALRQEAGATAPLLGGEEEASQQPPAEPSPPQLLCKPPRSPASAASTHLVPEDVPPVVLAPGAIGQAAGADAVEEDARVALGWDGAQQVVETPAEGLPEGQRSIQLYAAASPQRGPRVDVGGVQGPGSHVGQPFAVAPLHLLLALGHGRQELPGSLPLLPAQRQGSWHGGPEHVDRGTGTALHLGNQRLPVDVAAGDSTQW